jgi:uncharacterized protein YyaL (SSP411 family)
MGPVLGYLHPKSPLWVDLVGWRSPGYRRAMPNHLGDATSPYLLQHADHPVDWREWGDDAFAEARQRGVPVFLSVGYAACHWYHEVVV